MNNNNNNALWDMTFGLFESPKKEQPIKAKRTRKPRTLLNNKEKKQFLQNEWKFTTLNFKYSKNGVCRIYNRRNEKTVFFAGGGGYDKKGVCLANFIEEYFKNELKKINSSKFYGLTHYNTKTSKYNKKANKNTKTYLEGASGFNSMERILNKIGFKLNFVYESNNNIVYTLNKA